MTEHVDCIVVGAGVVGLAIARRLAMAGREVILLEAADDIGTGTSSRNSEVIHAGLYYAKDSLKAMCCVAGRQMLYQYCESHGVAFNRIGKLVVATEESEVPALEDTLTKASANGVTDLRWVEPDEIREIEPNIDVVRALMSPSTGIVDSHGLMLAYQGDLEDHGGMIAFLSPVENGRVTDDGFVLETGGADAMTIGCRTLVNSAGLGAQPLGRTLAGLPAESVPPLFYAKGTYFTITGRSPFNHLIYPVPVPGGLGTHSTLDLGGQTKFGPDVSWVDEPDYEVDPARAELFYGAIRKYWPGLQDGALQPGYVGIRPKLAGPDAAKYANDFVIQGPADHGVTGLVNLYGIESPGLTSSLAIAEEVAARLDV
ncbi:MAG: NAD(P)/FAD-dependent oxidoreductase [Rhodospirillaceae bacterium]